MKRLPQRFWTSEEDAILINNWDDRENLEIWTKLLNRTWGAIIRQAIKLNLKRYYITADRALKPVPQFLIDAFLIAYKECRIVRPAYDKSGLGYGRYTKLMRTDPNFVNQIKEVELWMSKNPKCSVCNIVYENGLDDHIFHSIVLSGKTGTCKACERPRQAARAKTVLGKCRLIISGCRNRDHSCQIPAEDLVEMYDQQNGKCYYTGIPMLITHEQPKHRFLMSIDRKDNSMGYMKDNVVLCTWMVNHSKNTLSHDQFIEICNMVVDNIKR